MKYLPVLLTVIVVSTHQSQSQQNLYKLVLHSQDAGAACLDGSPPGLYLHEGTGANKNKFMVFFDGGGFCGAPSLSETLQSCYRRSSTSLGSTKNLTAYRSFDKKGILSPIESQNPVFHDWTKVYIIYCDGSQYIGHRQNPIQYKNKKLYFRGNRNVLQHFRYLDRLHDFYNGDTIVITGVSSGGMATYQWSNYLVQHTKKAKVYGIPDSGFFITDYYSQIAHQKIIRTVSTNLLGLINQNQQQMPDPIRKCLLKPSLDMVDCLNAGNYMQFQKAPMLIVESHYDAFSIQNILAVGCLKNRNQPYSLESCSQKDMKYIQDYRQESIQYLKKMKANRTDVGLWSPSCVQHGFIDQSTFTSRHFKVNGIMVAEAVERFLKSPERAEWIIDEVPWPHNTGCNGKILVPSQTTVLNK